MAEALWVYAFGKGLDLESLREELAVDGTKRFECLNEAALDAVYTVVQADAFSQSAVDAHANDLQWLGVIGLSHQRVNEALASKRRSIPLRAFTLFASTDSLRQFMRENERALHDVLSRLEGKSEWTFRLEIDADRWNETLDDRVEELRGLKQEIEQSSAGRAYLLRKKLDDVKKSAARTAEESLLDEVSREISAKLQAPIEVENRAQRNGSFPQINALIGERDQEAVATLERELNARYNDAGVTISISGPWPPYSFAAGVSA